MAVYVDPILNYADEQVAPQARACGRKWCHMFADTVAELHEMARTIGLKRSWFQGIQRPDGSWKKWPHYDLTEGKRWQAIRKGATRVNLEQAVTFWEEKGW